MTSKDTTLRARLCAVTAGVLIVGLSGFIATPALAAEAPTDSSVIASTEPGATDTESSASEDSTTTTDEASAPADTSDETVTTPESTPASEPVTSTEPTPITSTTPTAAPEDASKVDTTSYPTTPPSTPPADECVKPSDAKWSYGEPNWTTGTINGTVTNKSKTASTATKLCDPLATKSTDWEYLNVESEWEQGHATYNDLTIDALGSFTLQIPNWTASCEQGDFYAEFFSNGGYDKLKLPEILKGAHNPFEPKFLHEALPYAGGTAYFQTSSYGCNTTPPATPEPKVTYTTWTDGTFVCGDTSVTQTRTKVVTTFEWVKKNGTWVLIETVGEPIIETQTRALTEAEIESCKPEIPEAKITYTDWVDSELTCESTEVTQTRTKVTTPWVAVLTGGSTWELQPDTANAVTETETQTRPLTEDEIQNCTPEFPPTTSTPNPPQFVDLCGTDNDEVQKPSDTDEWTYTESWNGRVVTIVAHAAGHVLNPEGASTVTWTFEFTDEDCPVTTTTHVTPPTLAMTGTDSNQLIGAGIGALLLFAIGIPLVASARRRKATA